jgi:putative membrane protein
MSENNWARPWHFIRWVMLGILILILLGVAFSVISFILHPMTPAFGYNYSPFWPFPMGLFVGIFVIFIIFGILRWIFWPPWYGYRRRHWRYQDESYYILRQRYARGEITKEQFEQMTQDLRAHEQGSGKP